MVDTVQANKGRRVQVKRQPPSQWTARDRQRFLDHLAATCNVTAALAAIGKASPGAYRLRQRDAAFAAAWDLALAEGYARLEGLLLANALGTHDGESTIDPERTGTVIDRDLALKMLALRDGRAKAATRAVAADGCKRVPIGEVNRRLITLLKAVEKRLGTGA